DLTNLARLQELLSRSNPGVSRSEAVSKALTLAVREKEKRYGGRAEREGPSDQTEPAASAKGTGSTKAPADDTVIRPARDPKSSPSDRRSTPNHRPYLDRATERRLFEEAGHQCT